MSVNGSKRFSVYRDIRMRGLHCGCIGKRNYREQFFFFSLRFFTSLPICNNNRSSTTSRMIDRGESIAFRRVSRPMRYRYLVERFEEKSFQ